MARRLLLALTFAWVLYLIAANVFLLPSVGPQVLSFRPEKALYSWRWAASPLPGVVFVRDLEISGENRLNQWYLSLDRARGRIALLPLIVRRLSANYIDAAGVDFRLRRKTPEVEEAASSRTHSRHVASVPRRVLPSAYSEDELTPPNTRDPWKLSFHVLEVDDVRQLAIDEQKLTGDLRLEGRVRTELRRRSFALPRLSMQLRQGDLQFRGQSVATAIDTELRARIHEFSPREVEGRARLALLDLDASLEGTVESLGLLATLTDGLIGFDLDGSGRLTTRLEIDGGKPLPGSNLRLDEAQVRIGLLGHRLSGEGHLDGRVEVARGDLDSQGLEEQDSGSGVSSATVLTTLRAELTNPELRGPTPGLRFVAEDDAGAQVQLELRDWNLAQKMPPATARVEVPPLRIASLTALSWYLPSLPGFSIESGSGTVWGSALLTPRPEESRIELSLRGNEIAGSWDDSSLAGDLRADLHATQVDLENRTARLDGSTVEVEIERDGVAEGEDWRAEVRTTSACLKVSAENPPKSEAVFAGELEARLDDGAPLLALIAQRRWFLDWFDQFLNIEQLQATSTLSASPRGLVLEGLEVEGDAVEVLATLDLRQEPRRGIAFLRYNSLSAAVQLEPSGERDWKLLNSRAWFEQRLGRSGIDSASCPLDE